MRFTKSWISVMDASRRARNASYLYETGLEGNPLDTIGTKGQGISLKPQKSGIISELGHLRCVARCAYRLGAIAQTSAEFFDVEVADLGVERIA